MLTADLVEYEDILDASWMRLANAANDPSHPLHLLSFATTAPSGRPTARLMVLRGADDSSATLWFHTDRRSAKVQEIENQPQVCLVAYDPIESVQLRLDGAATIHTDDAVAERHWEQTDLAVRHAYGLSTASGQPLPAPLLNDPRIRSLHAQAMRGRELEARRNFAVIEVKLNCIEWMQIASVGQRKARLSASDRWRSQPLVP